MSFVRENFWLILIMIASGAMLVWPIVQRRLSPVKEIGNVDATQLINRRDALLLDVREPAEYQQGRLPKAVHIPLSQLKSRAAELSKYKSRPVVAYCAAGARSRGAGGALAQAGFTEVYSLQGGFRAWKEAGLPVEKG